MYIKNLIEKFTKFYEKKYIVTLKKITLKFEIFDIYIIF